MCFTWAWLISVIVWLIVVVAAVKLLELLIPFITGALGGAGSTIIAAIRIVLWAIVAIMVVYFVGDLIVCLIGAGGVGFPHLRG